MKKLSLLLAVLSTFCFLFYACTNDLTKETQPNLVNKNGRSATGTTKSVVQQVQVRPKAERNAKVTVAVFTPISDVSGNYLPSTKLIDISALTTYQNVSSVSDGDLTVSFSSPMQKYQAGFSWGSEWGTPPTVEGNNPHILFSNYQNSITLSFSKPISTFGYELQTNQYGTFNYTAEFYNGATL